MLAMYSESESVGAVNEIGSHEPARPSHGPGKRKCPPQDQPFMGTWLKISEFKDWLMKKLHCKKMKPYCELCVKRPTCSKTGIKRHEVSKCTRKRLRRRRQMINQVTTADATTTMVYGGEIVRIHCTAQSFFVFFSRHG